MFTKAFLVLVTPALVAQGALSGAVSNGIAKPKAVWHSVLAKKTVASSKTK